MRKLIGYIALSLLIGGLFSCAPIRDLGLKSNSTAKNDSGDLKDTSILQLTEIDAGGNNIVLDKGYRVIDPNSQIEIKINQSAILSAVAFDVVEDKALTKQLRSLNAMLEAEVEAMKKLNLAITQFNAIDKQGNRDAEWQNALLDLGPMVTLIFDNPEYEATYMSLGKSNDIKTQYQNLFKTAVILVNRLEEKIKEDAKTKGFYIQLGAWIEGKDGNRAIHILGFDDYKSSPSFRVEQFQVVLTEEQKQEIKAIAELASKANAEGLSAALNAQTAVKKIMLSVLELPSVKQAIAFQAEIKSILENKPELLNQAKGQLEQISNQLYVYKSYLQAKLNTYDTPQRENVPGDLLLQINSDVDLVLNKTKMLDQDLNNTIVLLEKDLINIENSTRGDVIRIKNELKKTGSLIMSDIDSMKLRLQVAIQTIVAGEEFRSEAYEFTDKVKKLSISKIPQQATLNLETTGKRDIGDRLIVKLAAGKASGETIELESKSYNLYFCTPFVRTAVGFLFTDPVPVFKRSPDKALFYYAPSYSILLKGFWKSAKHSRQNLNYHRLFSPGLGLNITTLDSDSNGAMEIGIGGVFSYFSDFLQIGYGANLFNGKGYSFFGLRIPVGAFAIR